MPSPTVHLNPFDAQQINQDTEWSFFKIGSLNLFALGLGAAFPLAFALAFDLGLPFALLLGVALAEGLPFAFGAAFAVAFAVAFALRFAAALGSGLPALPRGLSLTGVVGSPCTSNFGEGIAASFVSSSSDNGLPSKLPFSL